MGDDEQSRSTTHKPVRAYMLWAALLLASGVPRVVAAFLLPNEEGDPYSYARAIEGMRVSMSAGTFSVSDLFGFWLPGYQFICAVISVFIGHSFYVAKVVSALCGAGLCVVVFFITQELTASRTLSLIAFSIIALSPLHVMYSAFSLTDVPNAFLVTGSMFFVLKERWILAASCVAVACLMRIESWLIIPLLPALQFLLQRKVSITALFVALFSPVFWLYVCWAATGNALEYFKIRNNYISEMLAGDASLNSFSVARVAVNLLAVVYSTGPAVIIACMFAAWLAIKRLSRKGFSKSSWALAASLAYFFLSLGFLLLAYFTGNQPDIWPRYGLILFALGLPILAWTSAAIKEQRPVWARTILVGFAALCLCQWGLQVRHGWHFIRDTSQKRLVADYLRGRFVESEGAKIFCDDSTVRVLSGIPASSFLDSSNALADQERFLTFLIRNHVEYLVYERREESSARAMFWVLDHPNVGELFQLLVSTNPGADGLRIEVYLFTSGAPKT
ncbi:MAG: phospholipid carrier-dependent glycosyltransferase [Acidobacteriota bacterium]